MGGRVWIGGFLVATWVVPSSSTWADVFFLTNGGRIEGSLLNPDESPRRTYQVQTECGGRLTLGTDLVDRVVVKSEAERRYEAFLPTVSDTVEGHWDAAERCKQVGLIEQRQFHLEQVIRIDPNHEIARRALGYSRINGQWTRQDDWLEKQGYVRQGGAWRLPQEIELQRAAEAQEQRVVEWRKKLKLWEGWIVKGRGKESEAVAAIRAIRDPAAAVALAESLTNSKTPRQLRQLYADVLAEQEGSAATIAFVQVAIQDPDEDLRNRCLDHLAKRDSRGLTSTLCRELHNDQNAVVQRAATVLGYLKDPAATLPLIEALITEHKQVIGGGGGIQPAFSDQGSGLSVGGRPQIIKHKVKNEAVLRALTAIHPNVNFGYDPQRWRRWYVEQNTPRSFNLRRSE